MKLTFVVSFVGQSGMNFFIFLVIFLQKCGMHCCTFAQKIPNADLVAGVLFYTVVCLGGSIKKRDATQLDRLVRKAGSVVGTELEPLTLVTEKRAPSKLLAIICCRSPSQQAD